jgi:hypothetical protein
MSKSTMSTQPKTDQKPTPRRPNETGSVSVEAFVKIFDPKTKRVFVEKRA